MTLSFRFLAVLWCALLVMPARLRAQEHLEPTDPPATTKAAKPKKPPEPAFVEVADVAGLPRVLLIGDSISIGYTLPVREKLAGKANVHRPAANCGDTNRGINYLDRWLGEGKWDVIHFNFGMHDLKYLDKDGQYVSPENGKVDNTLDAYEANLRKIVERLKKTNARLIFATTTPVPRDSLGRIEGNQQQYNERALKVMREMGVEVDDLCAYVEEVQKPLAPLPPKPATGRPPLRHGDIQLPYNVHYTSEGYMQLADRVATSILKVLPSKEQ